MTQVAIEYAARKAWPALIEEELSYGVLRFARGVSRRSNSLNVFVDEVVNPKRVRADAEGFFGSRGLPAIVRIVPSLAAPDTVTGLDAYLANCQYARATPTAVMYRVLGSESVPAIEHFSHINQYVEMGDWLDVWAHILNKTTWEREIYQVMLLQLTLPHCFVVRRDENGLAMSCGMAVCSDGMLGVFGIATDAACRGRGHAQAVIAQLMLWGISALATSVYLQVECANKAAVSVYKKLGFRFLYEYWYREKNCF